MPYKTTEVTVDFDLSDFDDEDLLDELYARGLTLPVDAYDESRELLEKIWINRRNNKDFDAELDSLIYCVLGKVV